MPEGVVPCEVSFSALADPLAKSGELVKPEDWLHEGVKESV